MTQLVLAAISCGALGGMAWAQTAPAPTILSPPTGDVVSLGQAVSLHVLATNNGSGSPLAYQWLKDGVFQAGQTNATLDIPSFQFTNLGNYQVVVASAFGTAISLPTSLSTPGTRLQAFGDNHLGQFGDGNTLSSALPIEVASNVVTMAAGNGHSLYLLADHSLWAMGYNFRGQLGNQDLTGTNVLLPQVVASNVVTVAAGANHSLFITGDGILWGMGDNADGELGRSLSNSFFQPILVASNVVAIAAGSRHSLFVKADASLWAMGNNLDGQLGFGPSTPIDQTLPVMVATNVVAAVAGDLHSLFLKVDGSLWGMGNNHAGALGNTNASYFYAPVLASSNVVAAAAGGTHSLFVKNDGTLWGMGDNSNGRLGPGNASYWSTPQIIAANVQTVTAGQNYSVFLKTDGTAWGMGANTFGNLGLENTLQPGSPVQLPGITAFNLCPLDQAYHTLLIGWVAPNLVLVANQIFTNGIDYIFQAQVIAGSAPFTYQWFLNGQAIIGATNSSFEIASATVNDVGFYTCEVTGAGGTATLRTGLLFPPPSLLTSPVGGLINPGQDVSLSATATNHGFGYPLSYQWMKDGGILPGQTNSSLALAAFQFTNSGTYQVVIGSSNGMVISQPTSLSLGGAPLQAWGENSGGQLGTSNTVSRSLPINVASNVVSACAGAQFSLFLRNDGSLWGSGANASGVLGQGNTLNSLFPVKVASNVVAAAAGSATSLFIKNDGTLWGMGNNQFGGLGLGNYSSQNSPALIASNVVASASGSFHSLFLNSDGSLWTMGYNSSGQLGTGSFIQTNRPVKVASNVVAVAAGDSHSLFLTGDGTLWGMGKNQYGQLGILTPAQAATPLSLASNVIAFTSGANHTVFIRNDHTAWGMGYNADGELGIGNTNHQFAPVQLGSNMVAVVGGRTHTLLLSGDGSIWSTGGNLFGGLGTGDSLRRLIPVQVRGLVGCTLGTINEASSSFAVALQAPQAIPLANLAVTNGAMAGFSLVVTNGTGPLTFHWQFAGTNLADATNSSYAIASVDYPNLGTYTCTVTGPGGSSSYSATLQPAAPTLIGLPVGGIFAPGMTARLSVSATNGGFGYPLNYQWLRNGVILPGQTNADLMYDSFQFTNSGNYQAIVGSAYGMAITLPAALGMPGATLQGWGNNNSGDLGIGNTSPQYSPVTITSNVVMTAASQLHTLLVKADRTLWAMGYNLNGQLGLGNTSQQNSPVFVASNVVSAAAGFSHSLFVKSDGTLWAMGYNSSGQLGNGNVLQQLLPVKISSNVVFVAAGATDTLFIKSDGSLWGMGLNNYGQLGYGNNLQQNSPVWVASQVVTATIGSTHSLFVTADGSLWGMGYNLTGPLGIPSLASTNLPVLVATNVLAASAGQYHSLLLKRDYSLWGMGGNSNGQLGNGGNTQQNSPVQITNQVIALAAGQSHSLFVRGDGSQWAMGNNTQGQLGTGGTTQQFLPARVLRLVTAEVGVLNLSYHSLAMAIQFPLVAVTNQSVLFGGVATFTANLTQGTGPFSYQWQFGGTNLPGATDSSLTLNHVTFADAGSYSVLVTAPAGTASTNASLTVTTPGPAILAQPQGSAALFGMDASLSVVATNGGFGYPLAYQWIKDGILLFGQTNGSLAIPAFQFTNSGTYQVVVSSTNGIVISLPTLLAPATNSLRAWGYNSSGQLGTGNLLNLISPAVVNSNVVASVAGGSHSLVIKNDGTLWAMGNNNGGQLGIGNFNQQLSPALVASNVVAAAAGGSHSLFLQNDGTLRGMGNNFSGQLGAGSPANYSAPLFVVSNVVSVAAGAAHSLFLKADGSLWGMGANGSGQLGIGNTQGKSSPVLIYSNVVALAGGNAHSLFITADGSLWTMGANTDGQLANGNTIGQTLPVKVASGVVGVAAGLNHSLFLKADSALWGVGDSSSGQLGTGTETIQYLPASIATNVVAVAAGANHTVYVQSDGSTWSMGNNAFGQLGLGTTTGLQTTPSLVPGLTTASLARMSSANHSLAVAQYVAYAPQVSALTNQTVLEHSSFAFALVVTNGTGPFTYQWQFNGVNIPYATNLNYMLLIANLTNAGTYTGIVTGPGGTTSSSASVKVQPYGPIILSPPTGGVYALYQSASLSVTATNQGDNLPVTYQWIKDGVLLSGQTNGTINFPSLQLSNQGVYQVATANAGRLALSTPVSLGFPGPSLQGWGQNTSGQLGVGNTNNSFQPANISSNAVAFTEGNGHSLFILNDGSLWAMGRNDQGQLGTGQPDNAEFPIKVADNVVAAAAGYFHSLFVKQDGSLWAMGGNNHGQLGIGNTTNQFVPVYVASNVVAVAAGFGHSAYLTANGVLNVMGYNADYELGNGDTRGSDVPLPVQVASDTLMIAAGWFHTLLVKSDLSLWGMGDNAYGELGTNVIRDQVLPIRVTTNVASISAGLYHSMFIRTDGTLWAMGNNSMGELGIGTTTSQAIPVLVASNVVAASAGAEHSVYVTSEGSLWSTGQNTFGQLGYGGDFTRTWPYQVDGLAVANLGPMGEAYHTLAIGAQSLQVAALTNQIVVHHTPGYGSPVSFVLIVVTGSAPFRYQWKHNGTNIAGATNAVFTLPAATDLAAGTYTGTVSGLGGTASSSAELVFTYPPPAIMVDPAGGLIDHVQAVWLTASVTNQPDGYELKYQWLKDGGILAGETNSYLNLPAFQFNQCGNYQLAVGSTNWVSLSLPVRLSVPGAPLLGWGDNSFGELGGGLTSQFLFPTQFVADVAGLSGDGGASLFIRNDHTLWAMGRNYFGELGNGDLTGSNVLSPQMISGHVVAAATSGSHSLFLKEDGSLWGMGANALGQLGNGAPVGSNAFSPVLIASNVVCVATGARHSLFIQGDGSLWGMGGNDYGQLGVGGYPGANYSVTVPQFIANQVVAVAAGGLHSLFLKSDGSLWGMGNNHDGELGIGYGGTLYSPVPIANGVLQFAAGFDHSLFTKSDHSLWVMGYNTFGQLGNGDTSMNNVFSPQMVASGVSAVAGGFEYSIFAKIDGSIWAMGFNDSGQLGTGDTVQHFSPARVQRASNASLISAGSAHSLAVALTPPRANPLPDQSIILGASTTFDVKLFGGIGSFSYQWQFNGTNITAATNSTYSVVNASLLDAGTYACTATSLAGTLVVSAHLSVTIPRTQIISQPSGGQRLVGQSASLNVTAQGFGNLTYQWLKDGTILPGQTNSTLNFSSFQFTNSGNYQVWVQGSGPALSLPANLSVANAPLLAWGANAYGQLGVGNTNQSAAPGTTENGVQSAAAGLFHSLFIRHDGSLAAMGLNQTGQLGNGSLTPALLPVSIASNVLSVAAGAYHSAFLRADGSLWTVGDNQFGQLGNPYYVGYSAVPVLVTSNVTAVAAGRQHTLFLKNDGVLWGMGNDSQGELGDGNTIGGNLLSPIPVATNVVAMAAGGRHSLFLGTDQVLWAMGANNYGQLGNGDSTGATHYSPIIVASNVLACAAGSDHSLFIKADGSLWVMGQNSFGQLGNGDPTGTNAVAPQCVASNVTAATAGAGHSLFIGTNASLWAMGDDSAGQLGLGNVPGQIIPLQIPGVTAASLPSMSLASHSLAIALVTPTLTANYSGGALILSWTNVTASLQSAPQASGPYTKVLGAISPFTVTNTSQTQLFFRLISP